MAEKKSTPKKRPADAFAKSGLAARLRKRREILESGKPVRDITKELNRLRKNQSTDSNN